MYRFPRSNWIPETAINTSFIKHLRLLEAVREPAYNLYIAKQADASITEPHYNQQKIISVHTASTKLIA